MAFTYSRVKHNSTCRIPFGPLLIVNKVTNGEDEGTWAEVKQACNSQVRDFADKEVADRKT